MAQTAYLALFALQHRGQESCGIAVNDDGVFRHHRGDGLVPDVFSKEQLAALGTGNMAIGHVRYSTTGYGYHVMIDHGGGLYTVYMHASSLLVSPGQTVSAGDVIAKVGSTGISTGSHLHFGVSLNGSYVSPWSYLGG